jgi:transposase
VLREDVGMGKGSSTRRYTEEFKRDAVALVRSSGRPIKEVARQLGISDTSLGTWVRGTDKPGIEVDVDNEKEAARLRQRVRELEEEIDILKRFPKYWVKDTGR